VVASNRSAVPELIDEAGLLVDPENEADLTNAMGRIVDDAALRDRLRARGRERIAAFQPDVLAARLAGVYRLALEQPYAVRSRGSKMDIR
jgi:glycosyltransferase involved in cell wall biosynthesis